mgnify:CR=1 FL=1|jgi:hypothetical protein
MSQYFKAEVKQRFLATINNIEIIFEDKFQAVKKFLTDFSEIVDDIKSDNKEVQFEEISDDFIQSFIDVLDEICRNIPDSEEGTLFYDGVAQYIVVDRHGVKDDLSDIFVTYMGEENTYFKDFNKRLKEKDF